MNNLIQAALCVPVLLLWWSPVAIALFFLIRFVWLRAAAAIHGRTTEIGAAARSMPVARMRRA